MAGDPAEGRWRRLQQTVHERLDVSGDYVDAVVQVVDSLWTQEQRRAADAALENRDTDSLFYTVLMDDFGMRTHYSQADSHRVFVARAYDRLSGWLELMTPQQAEAHDLSKYELAEALGYTLRWVHGREGSAWTEALGYHYSTEQHHPQYFLLGRTGDGRMSGAALQESLADMVACRWERQLHGATDVTDRQLVDIAPGFLERYQPADRAIVRELMRRIADS